MAKSCTKGHPRRLTSFNTGIYHELSDKVITNLNSRFGEVPTLRPLSLQLIRVRVHNFVSHLF